ncbi:hypothetical protein [Haloarchaeobius sp. TZWWS8]
MPTCPHCKATLSADELDRHEHEDLLFVYCPHCHCVMGQYRDPCLS